MNSLFDLSKIFTDNPHPSALISLIVHISLAPHPRVTRQVDEFPVRIPGEVGVGHDGSASVGKLSAQNVGRTVDDRSISRSTEPGENALRPGARSNEGI